MPDSVVEVFLAFAVRIYGVGFLGRALIEDRRWFFVGVVLVVGSKALTSFG